MKIITRRSFVASLAALITAPAIVRAHNIMPVHVVELMKPSPGLLHVSTLELIGNSGLCGDDGAGEIVSEITPDLIERIMSSQFVYVR
jgi:hypothetical protein